MSKQQFFKTRVSGAKWLNDTVIPSEAILPAEQERQLADYFTHAVTTAFLLHKILAQLEGTAYDSKQFRMKFRQFMPELVKLAEVEISNLCDVNHFEAIWNILHEQEDFMAQVARFKSTQYPVLTEIFRLFKEDECGVMEKLGIKVSYNPRRLPEQ